MLEIGRNGATERKLDQHPAWVKAHGDVLTVARERAGLERREGTCLLRALREDVHRLGYGAFAEYSDRHLGYGHRTTQDKLRTAEALERLPELARALEEGRLHASAVRELARVATPQTEAAWIDAAAGRRIRDIEHLVAGRARGDHPSDAPRPDLQRHVLRFEVSGETLAAIREALQHVREQSGEHLEDDAALLLLARTILCGPVPDANEPTTPDAAPTSTGRSKYQINVQVCEHCQRGFQRAGADLIEIDPAMLDAARCDAHVPRGAANEAPATHVGAELQPARSRAVPAATRRHVLERDQHRCQIPGCRHTLDIDIHHIVPRAEGGTHHPDHLVTLCGAHHRSVHAGRLHLSGKAGATLRVHHADGSPYGAPIDPSSARLVDISEKVFRGLRWLGFKETEAKRAVAAALDEQDASADTPTADELLKRALALMATTRAQA